MGIRNALFSEALNSQQMAIGDSRKHAAVDLNVRAHFTEL